MRKGAYLIPKGTFFLKERKNEDGKQLIYIRYFCRGKYVKRSMGIAVRPEEWDDKKQKIVGARTAENIQRNNTLLSFKTKIDQQLL